MRGGLAIGPMQQVEGILLESLGQWDGIIDWTCYLWDVVHSLEDVLREFLRGTGHEHDLPCQRDLFEYLYNGTAYASQVPTTAVIESSSVQAKHVADSPGRFPSSPKMRPSSTNPTQKSTSSTSIHSSC